MSSALLVMDFQAGVVSRLGDHRVVTAAASAVDHAHRNRVQVVYVRVVFRPGHPEVSTHNRSFAALADAEAFGEADAATQLDEPFQLVPEDVVVLKRRVSAFTGSDLEVVLRSRQVDSLVLTGIATSGVVLSTLREAADRDYRLTVLADACADADPEVHRVLTEKVFPRQAEVVEVAEWAARLGSSS